MFDEKILKKLLVVIILVIIIIVAFFQTRKTLSKYESEANVTATSDIAFWVVDNTYEERNLTLVDLYPSESKFESDLCSVSNFKDGKRTETVMSYYLVLTVTTNLPLTFEVEKDGVACKTTEKIVKDDDGTFYKKITIKNASNAEWRLGIEEDETHNFKLYTTFPKSYNTQSAFADLIESAKIEINATQVIKDDI